MYYELEGGILAALAAEATFGRNTGAQFFRMQQYKLAAQSRQMALSTLLLGEAGAPP